jgi:hypothetical protein
MQPLQTILASLGNPGAIRNAHLGIEQRAREDWLVACLEAKLAPPAATARPAPVRAARRTAA